MDLRRAPTAAGRLAVERPGLLLVGIAAAALAADLLLGLATGEIPIARFATLLWDGLVVGSAIGLAGIGLSMTYAILGFANFSHGDYVTGGAFAGWAVTFVLAGLATGQGDLGYLLSVGSGQGPTSADLGINVVAMPLVVLVGLAVAIVATVGLVLLVDRLVYRPMRDAGAISLLIASIGVALALRYAIVFVFTGTNRGLTAGGGRLRLVGRDGRLVVEGVVTPAGAPQEVVFAAAVPAVRVGDYAAEVIAVTSNEVTLVAVAVGLMAGLHLMLQHTKLGTAMRAMADNEDLALVTGIPTERVIRATWIIGGGFTGAAGYLLALERGTLSFNLGWVLLLLIFAAVILGGIGSIYGAMAGGVIIGIVDSVSLIWIPSSFTTAAAFAIMILMLLFKPEGLFGGVTTA